MLRKKKCRVFPRPNFNEKQLYFATLGSSIKSASQFKTASMIFSYLKVKFLLGSLAVAGIYGTAAIACRQNFFIPKRSPARLSLGLPLQKEENFNDDEGFVELLIEDFMG